MEYVLSLCFRSCLKGDNDREYYNILELDQRNPTTDDVKRSYKKLSLSLHPDKLAQRGLPVTADSRQAFVKVKEAYDVLSDPKRRRMYDSIGATGLKLIESPQEVNPAELLKNFQKNRGDRCSLLIVIMLIFAALFVLPILFCLKCDGTLDASVPWLAIWTPMWIVDGFLLIIAVSLCMHKNTERATDHTANSDNEGSPEPEHDQVNVPVTVKISNFFSTASFILIQVFVLAHLDHRIHWSWFATFSPWFIYEGINVLVEFHSAFLVTLVLPETSSEQSGSGYQQEHGDDEDHERLLRRLTKESEHFEASMQQQSDRMSIYNRLFRVWLAIFLALKLDSTVSWNWGLVFFPIWTYFFVNYAYAIVLRIWGQRILVGLDDNEIPTDPAEMMRLQRGQTLVGTSGSIIVGQTVLLLMALMLVSRLAVTSFSTFVIIFPVFVILGCCCCAVCCFMTMLANVNTDELISKEDDRPAGDEENGGVDIVTSTGAVVIEVHEETTTVPTGAITQSEYGTFAHAVSTNEGVDSSVTLPPPPPTTEDLNSID